MSGIYLPLRSNAAWFASETHREQLERRLKNLVMVHDSVTLQNGRYHRAVSASGAFDYMTPASAIAERDHLRFIAPGTPFTVNISRTGESDWHPLVGGAAVVNYEVDFYPLFHDAGLVSAPYIVWSDADISSKGKQTAQRLAAKDRDSASVRATMPEGHFLQQGIIDGLYMDSLLAQALKLPISVDYHVAPLIDRGNANVAEGFSPEPRGVLSTTWIDLGLPDAGTLSWEEVNHSRESAAGAEYRSLVGRLTDEVIAGLGAGATADELQHAFQQALVKQLVEEVFERRTSVVKAAINVGLNLIPYGGLASSANDIRSLAREQRSWVSLLRTSRGPPIVEREE